MTVNVYAATPPELGSNVFDDNASDRKIYVPYAALDDYKDAYGWSNYKDDILPLAATLPQKTTTTTPSTPPILRRSSTAVAATPLSAGRPRRGATSSMPLAPPSC